ncbi:hypothetical protein FSARC_12912 [Fusarium sarcochroum]|uniref:Uncharacterized protein n=1 Tax=Fusarium sarcochroum TaxID=1208366 RepID=A0A8H4T4Y8_9HYPO|nr:hypothetical protein FSARC_12912 [Fusarium sarcochroum]
MKSSHSPAFKRFLSDFTLGFSDGLTVPFALTAGLSSLGKTDTVITGGLAELCAGSISMGIGGYLAALDECTPCQSDATDIEEVQGMLNNDGNSVSDSTVDDLEKTHIQAEELVRQHLEPLGLPSSTVSTILKIFQKQCFTPLRANSTITDDIRAFHITWLYYWWHHSSSTILLLEHRRHGLTMERLFLSTGIVQFWGGQELDHQNRRRHIEFLRCERAANVGIRCGGSWSGGCVRNLGWG